MAVLQNMNRKESRGFLLATAVLLLLGILGQVLCHALGYGSDLAGYFTGLLPVLAVLAVAFGLVTLLNRKHWAFRTLLISLGVVLAAANLLVVMTVGVAFFLYSGEKVEYVDQNDVLYADPVETTQELLGRCHLVGEGNPVYRYPEPETYAKYEKEYSWALGERNRMAAVFGDYTRAAMLPVLSWSYGLWVAVLYTIAAGAWIAAAGGQLRFFAAWWKKWLFVLWGSFPALQLVCTVLAAWSLAIPLLPWPFGNNHPANLLFAAPQLGAMLALSLEKKEGN